MYYDTTSFLRGNKKLSHENQKQELKRLIEELEKEILKMTGNQRAKARAEYYELLKAYRKECGLDEPIYIIRA